MKILKRTLIILGMGVLVALVTWAMVSIIMIASLPTDTMDYTVPAPVNISVAAFGVMGYIKPLAMITLIVLIEQLIENLFNKKKRRAQTTNA